MWVFEESPVRFPRRGVNLDAEMMTAAGFRQGSFSTCVFYRGHKNVRVAVHGEDPTALGLAEGLGWFRKVVQLRRELKLKGRLEGGKPGAVRILKRFVTVAENGLEYEADQRCRQISMKDVGIDEGSMVTPGVGTNEGGGGWGGVILMEKVCSERWRREATTWARTQPRKSADLRRSRRSSAKRLAR